MVAAARSAPAMTDAAMPQRHIVFATAGSLGDLYPFLALGRELRQRGKRVTVATSANHQRPVLEAGLAFRHMRPDPENTAAFHARYMHPKTGGQFVYQDYLGPAIRRSYDDLAQATQDADLLVSQSLMALAAPLVAARSGIPWVSAVFQPMSFFSVHERPNYLPFPLLPWLCGRSPQVHQNIFQYVRKHTEQWVQPVLDLRQELGIAQQGHPMYEGQHSPGCVLAMFSPMLGGPQPDWPPSVLQTGTAQLPQQAAPLPGPVRQFIERDDLPLAIFTLSSAASNDAGDFYRNSLEASAALGIRALLITSGLAASARLPEPLPGWACRVDYAAFEQVFPHAAVVVHAGGIGTAFKAMQAGAPQIVLPHAHDQLDNALRLERLGVARLMRGKRAGVRALRRTLREVLADRQMQATVTGVARMAREEDGVTRACDVIEQVLRDA
jgi:UDP:flavonoid glycosyltransferase YjiC (YdhE family)